MMRKDWPERMTLMVKNATAGEKRTVKVKKRLILKEVTMWNNGWWGRWNILFNWWNKKLMAEYPAVMGEKSTTVGVTWWKNEGDSV